MVSTPTPSNADLADLLWRAGDAETDHRRRALHRASRAARFWDEEAADLVAAGRSLTELRAVGPWVADRILAFLEGPPPAEEPDPARRGFLTMADVRRALEEHPEWEREPCADLQVHTTDSDGALPLAEAVETARGIGRTCVAITDHSQSLKIANGMSEERLADQGRRIDALNRTLAAEGTDFRVLRSIEMDVFVDGSADMPAASLEPLDLVLGAFHSRLRVTDDQTDRYVAALRNPTVDVLAHPKARMYGRRVGLSADWRRVFAEAATIGKAVEIDATPARQDLSVELARLAVAEGVRWYSIGSDAHVPIEFGFLVFGLAIAALAGVPRDRVLNFRPPEEIAGWARRRRADGSEATAEA